MSGKSYSEYLEQVCAAATKNGIALRDAFRLGKISKSTFYRTMKHQTKMRPVTAEAIIDGITRKISLRIVPSKRKKRQ